MASQYFGLTGSPGFGHSGGGSRPRAEHVRQQLTQHRDTDAVLGTASALGMCDEVIGKIVELARKSREVSFQGAMNASEVRSAAGGLSIMASETDKRLSNCKVPAGATEIQQKAVKDVAKLTGIIKSFQQIKDRENAEAIVKGKVPELTALQFSMRLICGEARRYMPPEGGPGPQQLPPQGGNVTPEQRQAELEIRRLELSQKRRKEAYEDVKTLKKNLTDIQNRLRSLDTTKVELDEIIETLRNALIFLDQLKIHWANLLRFFKLLSMIVQNLLSTKIDDFKTYIDQTLTDIDEKKINTAELALRKTELACNEFMILQVRFVDSISQP